MGRLRAGWLVQSHRYPVAEPGWACAPDHRRPASRASCSILALPAVRWDSHPAGPSRCSLCTAGCSHLAETEEPGLSWCPRLVHLSVGELWAQSGLHGLLSTLRPPSPTSKYTPRPGPPGLTRAAEQLLRERLVPWCILTWLQPVPRCVSPLEAWARLLVAPKGPGAACPSPPAQAERSPSPGAGCPAPHGIHGTGGPKGLLQILAATRRPVLCEPWPPSPPPPS